MKVDIVVQTQAKVKVTDWLEKNPFPEEKSPQLFNTTRVQAEDGDVDMSELLPQQAEGDGGQDGKFVYDTFFCNT